METVLRRTGRLGTASSGAVGVEFAQDYLPESQRGHSVFVAEGDWMGDTAQGGLGGADLVVVTVVPATADADPGPIIEGEPTPLDVEIQRAEHFGDAYEPPEELTEDELEIVHAAVEDRAVARETEPTTIETQAEREAERVAAAEEHEDERTAEEIAEEAQKLRDAEAERVALEDAERERQATAAAREEAGELVEGEVAPETEAGVSEPTTGAAGVPSSGAEQTEGELTPEEAAAADPALSAPVVTDPEANVTPGAAPAVEAREGGEQVGVPTPDETGQVETPTGEGDVAASGTEPVQPDDAGGTA